MVVHFCRSNSSIDQYDILQLEVRLVFSFRCHRSVDNRRLYFKCILKRNRESMDR